MSDDDSIAGDAGILVDVLSRVLDLDLTPASREEVIRNLLVLNERAATFCNVPLDESLEPAPVFRL